jgi:hypothetical protein
LIYLQASPLQVNQLNQVNDLVDLPDLVDLVDLVDLPASLSREAFPAYYLIDLVDLPASLPLAGKSSKSSKSIK